MNALIQRIVSNRFWRYGAPVLALVGLCLLVFSVAYADTPAGKTITGPLAVPNPGTQEQELPNITFPAPYNVFEFVVTCAACHSGTVDQSAGHFSNWAGTAMASAMRDPVFRANQQIVDATLDSLGLEGAGNICIRCHSPNAWYSGRTDPFLAGKSDASNVIHSIVLSTDDEGIMCEYCHRSIGNVTMGQASTWNDGVQTTTALDPADPAWNMLAGTTDWPHAGVDYPNGPVMGDLMGDATMQLSDGMTYSGKYPGIVAQYFSDVPATGTGYTGQTYGIFPPGWRNALGEDVSGLPAVYVDGSEPIVFEAPIGPPITDIVNGQPVYDYQGQAISLEHPTVGGDFLTTSEFCGTCHDLTIPVVNHGMPEQRTYSEWKYSEFGDGDGTGDARCQDCHMPTMKHEYADDARVSLNPDPALAGWFPYGKDRNPNGGTAFHKFGGANRDLPEMMKLLYPEVDLEIIGAPTGNDVRIFPGMLSSRDIMYDRAKRNTEIMMDEAVTVEVVSVTEVSPGVYEAQVQVTNNTGHRIPSGYPDGRRLWLGVEAFNGATRVYQSGAWNEANAMLYNDAGFTGYQLAQDNLIDATQPGGNAVMVYQKLTALCGGVAGIGVHTFPPAAGSCAAPSPALVNNTIVFDNRIPPLGWSSVQYEEVSDTDGLKFVKYNPATNDPSYDFGRFTEGANYDIVTYRFAAPAGQTIQVRAAAYWQTHTREFMDYLLSNNSTYRPEGPPNILDPNYPLTPTYLSDEIPNFDMLTSLAGDPLQDNWGGIAYGAWLLTGKGAPYMVGADDTRVAAVPATPANFGYTQVDPFSVLLDWDAVAGAEGYLVEIRYGVDTTGATAAWDKLAIVYGETQLLNDAMNVDKTFGFRVSAFNGQGYSAPVEATLTTPTDLPLPPELLQVVSATANSVTLSWFDIADNETGFIIQRQDVPATADFYTIATVPTANEGGSGGNSYTDTTVLPSRTYNYRVAAFNAIGQSVWSLPVAASTGSVPSAPVLDSLTNVAAGDVQVQWHSGGGVVTSWRLERATNMAGPWTSTFFISDPAAVSYVDTTPLQATTYYYRLFAQNAIGDSPASNILSITTPEQPPAAPSALSGLGGFDTNAYVDLTFTDNATDELGFYVERADGQGPGLTYTRVGTIPARIGTGLVTWRDDTVAPAMTYSYRVQAYKATVTSSFSNVAVAITPLAEGQPPVGPSQLAITRVHFTYIRMSWRDNSTDELGFRVYRSTDGVNFTLRATVSVATLTDRLVTRGVTYYYYVVAYNDFGESVPSEIVSATVP